MLFRDVIYLIAVTESENDIGNPIEVEASPRQVFANKKSVNQSEFYQAAAVGIRPELKFVIRTIEYEGERIVMYNEKRYLVIRTYDKDSEMTELICQGIVGQGV